MLNSQTRNNRWSCTQAQSVESEPIVQTYVVSRVEAFNHGKYIAADEGGGGF